MHDMLLVPMPSQVPVLVLAFERTASLHTGHLHRAWRQDGGEGVGVQLHEAVGRAYDAGMTQVLVPLVVGCQGRECLGVGSEEIMDSVMQEASAAIATSLSSMAPSLQYSLRTVCLEDSNFVL